MQGATNPTRFGFFTGASNTDASGGVFTDIGGDLDIQNIHVDALNVRPPFVISISQF
jgi:hypothetical protein